jgi:hypothetical protein
MSQDFKLRFDEMRRGNPTSTDVAAEIKDKEFFDNIGHVRNLCFVWPDNKMKFYNYAYLVSAGYLPDDGSITLAFTTDIVILKGIRLMGLFEDLLSHLPRKIICSEERYRSSLGDNKPIIESIEIIAHA